MNLNHEMISGVHPDNSTKEDFAFRTPLEREIWKLFTTAFRISLHRPGFLLFLLRFMRRQRKARLLRSRKESEGINVPPFMIMSITRECNLNCKGCFSKINHAPGKPEMTDNDIISIMKQAEDLGVSIALLSGGEPLNRKGILEITTSFPGMLFPVFTNGLLINNATADRFRKQPNIVPIISLEGNPADTDGRRGASVHSKALDAMTLLKHRNIFFGISFTVTTGNVTTIIDHGYIREMVGRGVRLFFYNEYVPFEPGTEMMCLSEEQRDYLEKRLEILRKHYRALFISFPGDEAMFEGCLSAGRGFFHVNPSGDMEPCPFSPYSTHSLKETSLEEALRSKFLTTIRANHKNLFEYQGGCALWNNKEWVERLVKNEED